MMEQLRNLGRWEQRVFEQLLKRKHVARNTNQVFEEQLTLGQRVADSIAEFGGSWTFIFLFLAGMFFWMLLNASRVQPFDPFPFILLNLILSCLAALQAPVIMMSQNRQAAKDRLQAQLDYEVNLKAELEVLGVHSKLDELRDQHLLELREALTRQTKLLQQIESALSNQLRSGGIS
jgi:uncharacterized membrane protein